MPKRSYPFEDTFIPQSKVYVNIKRYNNSNEKLQKVYDNTLQLLFNGAKKLQSQQNVKPNYDFKADGNKELLDSKCGAVRHSGSLMTNNGTDVKCVCGNLDINKCYYCDLVLCIDCMIQCWQCMEYYCRQCFLVREEDSAICLSCYQ